MECDQETSRRANLEAKSDEETRRYIAKVFERDLADIHCFEQFQVDQLRLGENANWFSKT